jgi:hypothetical protein
MEPYKTGPNTEYFRCVDEVAHRPGFSLDGAQQDVAQGARKNAVALPDCVAPKGPTRAPGEADNYGAVCKEGTCCCIRGRSDLLYDMMRRVSRVHDARSKPALHDRQHSVKARQAHRCEPGLGLRDWAHRFGVSKEV